MTIGISQPDQSKTTGGTHLYVFSPSKENRLYQLQMDTLADRKPALDRYHVVIAEVLEQEEECIDSEEVHVENPNGLRREYHISPGQFKVVLVGEDASVKLCAESCVYCEDVFMRVEKELVKENETALW